MAEIIFLGTNGWYDTDTGNTICVLVNTTDCTIILDAGFGIANLDGNVDFSKPAYLFLSHFHLDHICGLHTICKYNFTKGLCICGQEGIASILSKILDASFTMPLSDLGFDVHFVEVPSQKDKIPFTVTSLPLLHASFTLGYRFEVDGKVITFCGDTGYCRNAVVLSEDADLLVAECAFRPGEEDSRWPHLNPEAAARIASESSAKRLALVHFDAERFTTMADRKEAEEVARRIFPETIASVDGMVIKL